MRLVVISDIHDNLVNLGKCLAWCKKNEIAATICPGDVCNTETLEFLNTNFPAPIYLVRGNMELFEDSVPEKFENINYGGRVAIWKIGGLNIGACHEPYLIDKVREKGFPDIIFYGHTHKPWEETRQGVRLVNPGTLGGVFSKATFATYNLETGELELIFVDNI